MELYLIKSALCLCILYGFYKLVLEKEVMHTTKRYYLLFGLVAGLVIPLISFTTYVVSEPGSIVLIEQSSLSNATPIEANPWAWMPTALWTIYLTGVIFFAGRFLFNLGDLLLKINKNPMVKDRSYLYVLLMRATVPHTFFSYIFLNKKHYKDAAIPPEVIAHEQAHAKQLHSIDVLLVELIQIAFWFNPLVYKIKESIKLNHEFLADRAVLDHGFKTANYQTILLDFAARNQTPTLANAIHYSSIKKRFTVMKTQTSKRKIWVKSLLVVPLLLVMLYGFSTVNEVALPSDSDSAITFTNADLYAEAKHPTYDDFYRWQNASEYHLLLDNQPINGKELMEYHPDDLPFFAEVGPDNQDTQNKGKTVVHIMTNPQWQERRGLEFTGEDTKKELMGDAYQEPKELQVVINKQTVSVNGKKTTLKKFVSTVDKATRNWEEQDYMNANIEIQLIDANDSFVKKLNDLYRKTKIFKAQPNDHGLVPPPPPPPPTLESKEFIIRTESSKKGDDKGGNVFVIRNPKAENVIIEEIETDGSPVVFKVRNEETGEVEVMEVIEVEEEMEVPIPPPPPKDGKTIYMINPDAPKVVSVKSVGDQNVWVRKDGTVKVVKVNSEEGKTLEYKVVPDSEIEVVDLPPPPPPPPAPEKPLDHIISMAKKGATFTYEGKPISSDRAIELIKENSKLNIATRLNGGKNPTVQISKSPIRL